MQHTEDVIPLSEIEYFLGAQASRKHSCKFICIPKRSMAKQFNSLFILLSVNLFACKLVCLPKRSTAKQFNSLFILLSVHLFACCQCKWQELITPPPGDHRNNSRNTVQLLKLWFNMFQSRKHRYLLVLQIMRNPVPCSIDNMRTE